MKYFTYMNNWFTPGNALHKDIQDYLQQHVRKNIPEAGLEDFKAAVLQHIRGLCEKNKRCKVIHASWQKHPRGAGSAFTDWDLDLSGGNGINAPTICDFRIYAANKSQELPQPVVDLDKEPNLFNRPSDNLYLHAKAYMEAQK
jgi:hypothetical protein